MNAKLLADNFKLKEDTSKLKELLETLQSNSPDVVQSPVSISQKVDLQKHLEQARITGHAAKLVELDKKATESQVGYNPNSRFVIRDNHRPVLATGCPSAKIQKQISDESVLRMAHGGKAYLSFQEWTDVGDSSNVGNPDITFQKYVEPVLASSTVPVYISKGDYYLMYQDSTCFFLTGNSQMPSVLRRSASECISGQTVDNSSILMSKGVGKYRDMTKTEYQSILDSQPSQAALLRIWIPFCNNDSILMDTSKATTIWSKE
jgi:hypothetical protein